MISILCCLLGSDGSNLVDDGKAILTELDIAEPLPCRESNLEIDATTEDETSDPSQPAASFSDRIVAHENAETLRCKSQSVKRGKRHIWKTARDWGTKRIPYQIKRSQFSEYL